MIDPKIEAHYVERTKRHIALVQKYCGRIAKEFPDIKGIVGRGKIHDASKFKAPEMGPYIWLTWRYKCEADGTDPEIPDGMISKINKVTKHHIWNNAHHPESHQKKPVGLLAKGDRDGTPSKIISAVNMSDLDIAEMVADWCAMGEELGNSPKTWADKDIGNRHKFTTGQTALIYKLISGVWTGGKKKQKTAEEASKGMSFREGLLLGALADDPASNPYIWGRLRQEKAMKKTASQIADAVLRKSAESSSGEHIRNLMVGGAGALSPLVGGIAASASKPEGDDTSQFAGTLGGSLLGQIIGSSIGHGVSKGRLAPTLAGMFAGGGLGSYGAQRLMASRRGDLARGNIERSEKQLEQLGQLGQHGQSSSDKTASIADAVLAKLGAYTAEDAVEDQQVDEEFMANNPEYGSMPGIAGAAGAAGAGLGAAGGGVFHNLPGTNANDLLQSRDQRLRKALRRKARVGGTVTKALTTLPPIETTHSINRLKGLVKRLGRGAAIGGALGLGAYGLHKAFGGGEEPAAKEASQIADAVLGKLAAYTYTDEDEEREEREYDEYLANNPKPGMGFPAAGLGGALAGIGGGAALHQLPRSKEKDLLGGLGRYTKDMVEAQKKTPVSTVSGLAGMPTPEVYTRLQRHKGFINRLTGGAAIGGGLGLGAYGLYKALSGDEEPGAKEASYPSTCSIADKVLAKLG